jgi:hypothetical protein
MCAGVRGFAVAGVCVLAGCASPAPKSPMIESAARTDLDSAVNEHGLVRRVVGPPIVGPEGTAYEHPWLGGLNQPRPQLADVDMDGDADLFVQERSGRVMHFENVGTGGISRFVWRSDRFEGLDVGEWYRFADMDRDGDPDLLGESQYSHVRLWRNAGYAPGRAPGAGFPLWADSVRDVAGAPIFSDRQNIPNAGDMDCDGRVDLFIGRLTGTVTRYEEVPSAERAAPASTPAASNSAAPEFALLSDRFQNIEIVAQLGSLHGANTLALRDVDDDGDLDMFWGDFFEPGLLLIENTGSCERPDLTGDPVPFPRDDPILTSGYNAPTFGDLDSDGDPDLVVGVLGGAFNPNRTSVENLLLVERQDRGRWVVRSRRMLRNLDVGSESVPAFGDWDADGDLDLLVANKIADDGAETSRIFMFENEGGTGRPAFRESGPLPIEGSYHYAPALGDLNGDGFADLVLGTWQDGILVYLNRASGGSRGERWSAEPTMRLQLSRGSNAVPALGDMDGDGDLDLLAGESSGEVNLWRNAGSPSEASFVLVTDNLAGIDAGRRSAPALGDWDGDGLPDLLLGSESEGVSLWMNGTSHGEFLFVPAGTVAPDAPTFAAPAPADADGDGDLDLFVGGIGGGVVYYERVRSSGPAM